MTHLGAPLDLQLKILQRYFPLLPHHQLAPQRRIERLEENGLARRIIAVGAARPGVCSCWGLCWGLWCSRLPPQRPLLLLQRQLLHGFYRKNPLMFHFYSLFVAILGLKST